MQNFKIDNNVFIFIKSFILKENHRNHTKSVKQTEIKCQVIKFSKNFLVMYTMLYNVQQA